MVTRNFISEIYNTLSEFREKAKTDDELLLVRELMGDVEDWEEWVKEEDME